MLLNIPLIQVVQVSAKGASLPIDMFCCCCWSYILLAPVVCSNPGDLRLQQALTTTTRERGHLIPGGSWRRLCAAWTLWMQIGGSKWPLTAATTVVGPRYMGVGSRQGRTRFTRWSTFFGGTHPLPTKPTNPAQSSPPKLDSYLTQYLALLQRSSRPSIQ